MIRAFKTIPNGALVLGVAGLIPFVAGGVLVWLPQVQNITPTIAPVVFFYAALIVSFLGGVRWGAAMQNATNATALARELSASVIPTLITLACYILSLPAALAMLLILIISQGLVDILAVQQKKLVAWYAPLRLLLSAVAGASLASILVYLAIQ